MGRRAALLALVACRGAPAPVANHGPDTRVDFELTTSRTPCFGHCAEYAMKVSGNGTVTWHGFHDVRVFGDRQAAVSPAKIAELEAALVRARFFERDAAGKLPKPMVCDNGVCGFDGDVICGDTSRTYLAVRRRGQLHDLDDDHCEPDPELDALEAIVEGIAVDAGWLLARRPTAGR